MISETLNHLVQETSQTTHETTPQKAAITSPIKEVSLGWNLSDGKAYFPEGNCPPAQVQVAFGVDTLHCCRLEGKFDFERAIEDKPASLVRSFRNLSETKKPEEWADVIFQFGKKSFLYGDRDFPRIVSYASTIEEAEQMVKEFAKRYEVSPPPEGGSFKLIKIDDSDISTHSVPLDPETLLSDEAFTLHYPEGSYAWQLDFEQKLLKRKQGLAIFEGNPGTGKTSYLRHLMGRLKESHRFYFIPPSSMSVLSNPKFIGFWATERRRNPEKKLLVVLEDADAALMTRGSDNQEEVSSILNLTDGMLGDFLGLQIICTINCRVSDIDQALLRPGRLIAHRKFERLNPAQAARLASQLGKSLPQREDYSLAEVFSGEEQQSTTVRPRMGFGSR